jgi:HEPN domain-containing protein
MKFQIPFTCQSCGEDHFAPAYAEQPIDPPTCPKCGAVIYLFDPLTLSIGAVRAHSRSQSELKNGDFSISIICSAVAVESYLTAAFLKWKGIANYKVAGIFPADAEVETWEQEFPRSGGFRKPADFVAKELVGTDFDGFVSANPTAIALMNTLPGSAGVSPKEYFQKTLFDRRNRVMHWGELDYKQADAELCYKAADAILRIFAAMDKEKADAAEKAMRKALGSQP